MPKKHILYSFTYNVRKESDSLRLYYGIFNLIELLSAIICLTISESELYIFICALKSESSGIGQISTSM